MPLPTTTAAALLRAEVPFSEDVPLARRTWWRTGGLADGLAAVSTLADLCAVMRVAHATSTPVFPLGNASNLLVSDAGIRGLVLQLVGDLASVAVLPDTDPPVLEVGAGMKLVALLRHAARRGWTGIECFAGIPGTVGGAVRMNAGAALGETKDCLLEVDIVLREGAMNILSQEELNMSYRTTHLPPGAVVARARLHTTGQDPVESQAAIQRHLNRRKATQPVNFPSCGSTFRNPPGDYAGRLIESADLKGFSIGGAQVAEKHANFILNRGGATADEIRSVIEHVQATVQHRFGVTLVREVHYAGDWGHWSSRGET